MTTRYFWATC